MDNPFFNRLTAEVRRQWREDPATVAFREEMEQRRAHLQADLIALAESQNPRASAVAGQVKEIELTIELMAREYEDRAVAEDDGWIDKATPQSKRARLAVT